MIGIICAMDIELETIKHLSVESITESVGYFKFIKGKIHGIETVMCVSGVGKVFAALCAHTMIMRFSPDLIINVGVGGNLTSTLKIGDITISENLVQHDMDTTPLGDPPGMISGINIIKFECDKKIVDKICCICKEIGINYKKGTIATGDRFIASKEEKTRLVNTFSAVSCDMEGAAIAQACYINNVPFVAIRALSDDADNASPSDFSEFCKTSAIKSAQLVENFIKAY